MEVYVITENNYGDLFGVYDTFEAVKQDFYDPGHEEKSWEEVLAMDEEDYFEYCGVQGFNFYRVNVQSFNHARAGTLLPASFQKPNEPIMQML